MEQGRYVRISPYPLGQEDLDCPCYGKVMCAVERGLDACDKFYLVCLIGEEATRQFESEDLTVISEGEFQSAQLLSA